jgi:hypothetical protein
MSKANTKWTQTECLNLARAWISASEDPIKGNDQTADTFMEKVYAAFVSFQNESDKKKSSEEVSRSLKSVTNYWSNMSKECSKFSAIYSRAVSVEHSGWNEQKYEDHAMKLYAAAEEADFLKEKKQSMKEGEEQSAFSRDEVIEVLEGMERGESEVSMDKGEYELGEHEVQEEQQPPKKMKKADKKKAEKKESRC